MEGEVYRALSDPTRRRVLEALRNHDLPIEVPTLVASEAAIYDEAVERQQIELYHNHLPKLDDMGFIEWDREQRVVEKGPRFENVLPMLEKIDTQDDSDNENGEEFTMNA